MSIDGLLGALLSAGVVSALSIALVLALRRPLRRAFGPGAAYIAWAAVPMAVLAAWMPRAPGPVAQSTATAVLAPIRAVAAGIHGITPGPDLAVWALLAWLAGALAMASYFVSRQRAFMRAMGPLTRRADGLCVAQPDPGLPAVVGFWHPRIVVPADFDRRYDDRQRILLVAHERAHVERGDIRINAVIAALRCVLWFNPLMHACAGLFRRDQELSCDRRVLARHPGSSRAYGAAMLNTQLAAQALPVGCQWVVTHPLKERIAMLKTPMPSRLRRTAGSFAIALLLGATGLGAWATQPAAGPHATPIDHVARGDTVAMPVDMQPPDYPKEALDKNLGGDLVLLLQVGADGNVLSVKVEQATPAGLFDRAAIAAASKWKFHPATSHGKPVASSMHVPLKFEPQMTVHPPKAG